MLEWERLTSFKRPKLPIKPNKLLHLKVFLGLFQGRLRRGVNGGFKDIVLRIKNYEYKQTCMTWHINKIIPI